MLGTLLGPAAVEGWAANRAAWTSCSSGLGQRTEGGGEDNGEKGAASELKEDSESAEEGSTSPLTTFHKVSSAAAASPHGSTISLSSP
ncbi:hypothetical protein JCM8547_008335 [Rhodosporidiobolus lusitaniae]